MISIVPSRFAAGLFGALAFGGLAFGAAVEPHPNRGLYSIWYSSQPETLDLPYIVGGQAIKQWADLAPAPGRFDFTALDQDLAALKKRGFPTTVQINGNRKPEWLFERVPYHPQKLSHQTGDAKGTLMYWHPAHREAYRDLLRAFSEYLDSSPYRDTILGIRLNFNALGTEHTAVSESQRSLDQWIVPPGVEGAVEWSVAVGEAYRADVIQWFVELLGGKTRVFVRNNISEVLRKPYLDLFETGQLCWFHTSSEAQSRGNDLQYTTFLEYCRTGKTLAYAESWASAWGHHGGKTDDRFCSPPQWNYWRLLNDLHCGVSFIAVYANDLGVAIDGVYQRQAYPQYQAEFDKAFRFASRYAGYHASPAQSPGAWAAFREGDRLKGDYDFLMKRLPDETQPAVTIGPDEQRFGAWARILPAGASMRLKADPAFLASLPPSGASVNVTYLDEGEGALAVRFGVERHEIALGGSGRWKVASLPASAAALAGGDGAETIVLEARGASVALHMAEILREGAPFE
ncbi:MAG: hypothetical protein BWZ10_01231 [candidate division BRC1 bacterium ADurb.BinA364]|nr:MAG: hypothetical protein BWZ10_01231 [candidate division BRC1 bacterium ADurb.BinA364]